MAKKKQTTDESDNKKKFEKNTDNKHINSQEGGHSKSGKTVHKKSGEAEVIAAKITEDENGKVDKAAKEAMEEQTLQEKLAEMQDRYLRLSAEFDNYRKRTLREKIDLTKHAGENILISIVPVMDDFERALKLMESTSDCDAMKDGINLIYNKFRDFLKIHGIKEIEALNSDFNVDLHEAVSKIAVEDESLKGKVVDVIQKGYLLHEKVMRFSKVVVGE
jgi:molecular chaperone GrpE